MEFDVTGTSKELTQEERDTFAVQYEKLIHSRVNKMLTKLPQYINIREDLEGVAWIGLVQAMNKFDKSKGYKFMTYSIPSIDNALLMYVRPNKNKPQDEYLEEIAVQSDDNSVTFMDMLQSNDNVEETVIANLERTQIAEGIKLLKKRERTMIIYHFGLFGYEKTTQRDLAQKMGLSQPTVCRILIKALAKLKKYFIALNKEKII